MAGFGDCEDENNRPLCSVGTGSFSVQGFGLANNMMMAKVKEITFYIPAGDGWKGPYQVGIEILHKKVSMFYAYVQFTVAFKMQEEFKIGKIEFKISDLTVGIRFTYKRPPPGGPGLAMMFTGSFEFEATTVDVGIQFAVSPAPWNDFGMCFELKQLTLFEVINGFLKLFGAEPFPDEHLLDTLLGADSGISVKFEVCVAYSHVLFVDMDVECERGMEMMGELQLFTSSWELSAKAELPTAGGLATSGGEFGALKYKLLVRNPMQMVVGFIDLCINMFTGGKPGFVAKLIKKFIEMTFMVFSITKVECEVDTGKLTSASPHELLSFAIEMKLLGVRIGVSFPPDENSAVDAGALKKRGVLGLLALLSPSAIMAMFSFEVPSLADLGGSLMDEPLSANPSMECLDAYAPIITDAQGNEKPDDRRLRKMCLFTMESGGITMGFTAMFTSTYCHNASKPGMFMQMEVVLQNVQNKEGQTKVSLCTPTGKDKCDDDDKCSQDGHDQSNCAPKKVGDPVTATSTYDQTKWDPQAAGSGADQRETMVELDVTSLLKISVYDHMGWSEEDDGEECFWRKKNVLTLWKEYCMRLKGVAEFTTGLHRYAERMRRSSWNAEKYESWKQDLTSYLDLNLKLTIEFAEIETALEAARAGRRRGGTNKWSCQQTIDLAKLIDAGSTSSTPEGKRQERRKYVSEETGFPFDRCLHAHLPASIATSVVSAKKIHLMLHGDLSDKLIEWMNDQFPGFSDSMRCVSLRPHTSPRSRCASCRT